MPRKKLETPEEELDIKKEVKKETFITRWFNDYAVNNKEEMKIICELTSRSVYEKFTLYVESNNYELYAAVFYATFTTILDFLRGKENKYNNFTIEVANSINIGYSNSTNEDNEKVGNFMPILEYIGTNMKVVDNSPESEKKKDVNRTKTNCMRWKQINVKQNINFVSEIQETAYERIKKEYRTDMRTSECVIPIFCIFMDNIIHVIKLKYQELEGTDVSEVSMNVLGLFDIYYSFNSEDNIEIIEFQPNIRMKLALKNDVAAGKDE